MLVLQRCTPSSSLAIAVQLVPTASGDGDQTVVQLANKARAHSHRWCAASRGVDDSEAKRLGLRFTDDSAGGGNAEGDDVIFAAGTTIGGSRQEICWHGSAMWRAVRAELRRWGKGEGHDRVGGKGEEIAFA